MNLWTNDNSSIMDGFLSSDLSSLGPPQQFSASTTTTTGTDSTKAFSQNQLSVCIFNQVNLQQRLEALIKKASESWTYAIFWEPYLEYPGAFVLGWGNGYYKGDELKGKGKAKMTPSSAAEQEHRKKVFRELNSLISGSSSAPDDAIDEEVTDLEWFFLVSMTRLFYNGGGFPGQAFFNSSPVWVTGSERLVASTCDRARQGQLFGLRTLVCIPSATGVVELGSTELIFQCSDLMNEVRDLFYFNSAEASCIWPSNASTAADSLWLNDAIAFRDLLNTVGRNSVPSCSNSHNNNPEPMQLDTRGSTTLAETLSSIHVPNAHHSHQQQRQRQRHSLRRGFFSRESKFKNYAGALSKQEREKWNWVLSEAAKLAGYHPRAKTTNEHEYIRAMVEAVTDRINEEEEEDTIHETTDFSPWVKGERIGGGAYGIVYVAKHRETGALCAVKELNIHKVEKDDSIRHEIEILKKLEYHPNIVEYFAYKEDRQGRISLYMEYIQPGSLTRYISERGKLHDLLLQNFTAQILFGLVHLHSNRQVHRDLKPDNILVDFNNIVKLVDFGLAKLLVESKGKHSVLGTLCYAAPEVTRNKNYERLHEALAADIWSLGCVVIYMFSGNQPDSDSDSDSYSQHPHIPEELCQEGKDFLRFCFRRKPAKRPSAVELLNHPFVKAQADTLREERTRIDSVKTL